MTAAAWPAGLPQCLPRDGQSEALGDSRIFSETDAGPAQVRPRSSAEVRPFSGIVVLSRDDLAALKTFVDTTLIRGSLTFTFPAQSEAGDWLVRFAKGGKPKWQPFGTKYRVTFDLEILP